MSGRREHETPAERGESQDELRHEEDLKHHPEGEGHRHEHGDEREDDRRRD